MCDVRLKTSKETISECSYSISFIRVAGRKRISDTQFLRAVSEIPASWSTRSMKGDSRRIPIKIRTNTANWKTDKRPV